jgi:hypothetical protein
MGNHIGFNEKRSVWVLGAGRLCDAFDDYAYAESLMVRRCAVQALEKG